MLSSCWHLLAASARLYGALLVLYPKAFRRRYGAEMRRDFCELMRKEFEERGSKELVRVWTQALPDLVLTALRERGIMPASLAYNLSADPSIATRTMAVVLVAVGTTLASSTRMPTYEASAQVLVDQKQSDR